MVPLVASVSSLVEPVSPVAPVSPLVLGVVVIVVPSGHVHGLHHTNRLARVRVAGPLHMDGAHVLVRVLVRLPLDWADLSHRLAVDVMMVLLRRIPTVSAAVVVSVLLVIILDVDDDNILVSLVSISLQTSQLADSAQLGQLGQETGSRGLLSMILLVMLCGMTNNPLILIWAWFRFTLYHLPSLSSECLRVAAPLTATATTRTVAKTANNFIVITSVAGQDRNCLIHWMRLHSVVALTKLYIGRRFVH